MKVSKVEKVDPNKYFDYIIKSLCKELSLKNHKISPLNIQKGFRFVRKRAVYGKEEAIESEITYLDYGRKYILKTFYPTMTQVIIHKIETFDESYQISYEEKLEGAKLIEKVKFAFRARIHGYRFKMLDIIDVIIDNSR